MPRGILRVSQLSPRGVRCHDSDEDLQLVTSIAGLVSFRNLFHLFLNMLSPAIVAKRRNSSVKRTPLLREEVDRTVAGPAKIDEQIHSLSDALIASEEGLDR